MVGQGQCTRTVAAMISSASASRASSTTGASARAAVADATRSSTRSSTRSRAPVSTMILRKTSTPASSSNGSPSSVSTASTCVADALRERRPPEASVFPRVGRLRPACRFARDRRRRRARRRGAGTPHRAGAHRRSTTPPAGREAPARQAPSSSGCSTEYLALLCVMTLRARAACPAGCSAPETCSRYVEELAADELGPHPVEHRPAPPQRGFGQTAGVQQLIAPAQTQVTQQDGGGVAEPGRISVPAVLFVDPGEPPVNRRHTAAGVGTVDQVVVDQRSGVEELQARRGMDDGLLVGSTGAAPAPVAERRSEPFATGQQICRGVDQRQQIATLRPEHRALPAGGARRAPAPLGTVSGRIASLTVACTSRDPTRDERPGIRDPTASAARPSSLGR